MMNAVPFSAATDSAEPVRGARAIVTMTPDYFITPPADRMPPKTSGKAGKIVLPTMEGLCFEKVKHVA